VQLAAGGWLYYCAASFHIFINSERGDSVEITKWKELILFLIMIELNIQKAKDLNEIVAKALEENQHYSNGFEFSWYQTNVRPDFTLAYCYHLHSLIKFYNEKYNRSWITTLDKAYVRANSNTAYFYQEGGYLTVLQDETRDQRIKELTELQLQKTIWQIKGWWIFVLVNAAISFMIALLTSKL
jgi:hypothetical protein